ncbi:hypothetical protein SteCoe_38385 [Stentor coeruleus]|uniref:LNR domain-containing protein n=1 Tax=Stentor coeruleus TaxID=5963 RepID=A0A1R2ALF0_9CILI|nr:hypothetical protein SteCoe_38385 [Stentor coeruleus]
MIIMSILILSFVDGTLFEFDESLCSNNMIGDLICNSVCNIGICEFDSPYKDSTGFNSFKHSDCYEDCLNTSCNTYLLGNEVCDDECNNQSCGWDIGDCNFVCNNGCTEDMLGNGICDPSCNVPECRYDNNDCGWCNEGCFKENLQLYTECIPQCNNTETYCFYEDNNPCFPPCAKGCPVYLLKD